MGEIFKMQRPIHTTGEPMILIYNEDRSFVGELPVTADILKMFGDDLKMYVLGHIDTNGKLNIAQFAEDQDW